MLKQEKELLALLEGGIKLPPQPQVLLDVEAMLRKGDPDARVLARVLSQDPGMGIVYRRRGSFGFLRPNQRMLRCEDRLKSGSTIACHWNRQ